MLLLLLYILVSSLSLLCLTTKLIRFANKLGSINPSIIFTSYNSQLLQTKNASNFLTNTLILNFLRLKLILISGIETINDYTPQIPLFIGSFIRNDLKCRKLYIFIVNMSMFNNFRESKHIIDGNDISINSIVTVM